MLRRTRSYAPGDFTAVKVPFACRRFGSSTTRWIGAFFFFCNRIFIRSSSPLLDRFFCLFIACTRFRPKHRRRARSRRSSTPRERFPVVFTAPLSVADTVQQVSSARQGRVPRECRPRPGLIETLVWNVDPSVPPKTGTLAVYTFGTQTKTEPTRPAPRAKNVSPKCMCRTNWRHQICHREKANRTSSKLSIPERHSKPATSTPTGRRVHKPAVDLEKPSIISRVFTIMNDELFNNGNRY